MARSKQYRSIPVYLSEKEFNKFVLLHLTRCKKGPAPKLSYHKIFNYILLLMHTGCQWYKLPIALDETGKPELSYSRIFKTFKRWVNDGCFEKVFAGSVKELFDANLLDLSIIHGDGTTTSAKKGAII